MPHCGCHERRQVKVAVCFVPACIHFNLAAYITCFVCSYFIISHFANFFLRYVTSKRKAQVLELMAKMFNFTEEDKDSVSDVSLP